MLCLRNCISFSLKNMLKLFLSKIDKLNKSVKLQTQNHSSQFGEEKVSPFIMNETLIFIQIVPLALSSLIPVSFWFGEHLWTFSFELMWSITIAFLLMLSSSLNPKGNFQFWQIERSQIDQGLVSMEGVALVESYVLPKTAD